MYDQIETQSIGKIPPQATDLEEVVLGAMMIDKRGVDEVIDILHPEVFYKEEHRHVFKAIYELYTKNQGIDLLTVSAVLKNNKKLKLVGGEFYLIQLTQKVSSSAHIEFHARIILQKYIQRKLIQISNEIIEDSYKEETDVFDLIDNAYSKLNAISNTTIKSQEVQLKDMLYDVIEKGEKIYNGEIKPGIETPIQKLNDKIGGWRNGELIILAARPGMGKTSFALSMALEPAKNGIPTIFFSLEMSRELLSSRIISMESKIDNQKFISEGLNADDVKKSNKVRIELDKTPFYIDDTSTITIQQLQIKAKKLKKKYGIKLMIVDYLQLMTGKENNREQEISKISRGLKLIAKDLDIPVIALSQLSRAVESRGGTKRPLLSDLRDSGAIEQDADVVIFLYRPEYYGIETWDSYTNGSTQGEAEYLVSKNRNGALTRNRVKFEAKYTLFSDLESDEDWLDD